MATHSDAQKTAEEIAEILGADLVGDGSRAVRTANFIERANEDELAFVGNGANLNRAGATRAKVIIVSRKTIETLPLDSDQTFILVDEPESAFLHIAEMLQPIRRSEFTGVSELARVANSAQVGPNSTVHPFACIDEDVVIGDGSTIGPGASIGPGCVIGDNVRIDANVVLYPDVEVKDDTTISANSVIGAEGFGYKTVDGRHHRLPHVGNVVIEANVDIGACSTIDRAKMGATVIGEGTKIDNLVVIAHNCQIGKHNLLVSQTGIAGSCSTGSYVVCAGQAGIADHVHLGDGAIIGAKAGVHRDMPGGQSYLGSPATPSAEQARIVSSLKRLPELRKTVKLLQEQIAELQGQLNSLQDNVEQSAAA